MSLVENDPILGWFWEFPTLIVAILATMAGCWMIWVIEFFRWTTDHRRPPYGLVIFRWRSNFIGDLFFLTGAVTILDVIYSKVEVDSSFFTDTGFFVITAFLGLVAAIAFVIIENKDPQGYGNPYVKQFNLNRVYHFGYFALMVYIFLGYLRLLFYWERPILLLFATACYLGWAMTIYLDGKSENGIWLKVVRDSGKRRYL